MCAKCKIFQFLLKTIITATAAATTATSATATNAITTSTDYHSTKEIS